MYMGLHLDFLSYSYGYWVFMTQIIGHHPCMDDKDAERLSY